MARKKLEENKLIKASLAMYSQVYDRACVQARKNSESMGSFVTRAIVNQLEREGDIDIRSIIREAGEDI